jgi:hypothetical protein
MMCSSYSSGYEGAEYGGDMFLRNVGCLLLITHRYIPEVWLWCSINNKLALRMQESLCVGELITTSPLRSLSPTC